MIVAGVENILGIQSSVAAQFALKPYMTVQMSVVAWEGILDYRKAVCAYKS